MRSDDFKQGSLFISDNGASKGVSRVLLTEQQVNARVQELGQTLTRDYSNREVVFLAVLKGALYFLTDLIRNVDLPLTVGVTSIERSLVDGEYNISSTIRDHSMIKGKHVVIVEDIVDTGHTIAALIKSVEEQSPTSIKVCTLLDKVSKREVEVPVDYLGFEIPPLFVVGYGLDYEEYYRNLPFIGVIEDASWDPVSELRARSQKSNS